MNGQSDAGHNKLFTTIMNAVGMQSDGGGPMTNFGDPDYCEPGELDLLRA